MSQEANIQRRELQAFRRAVEDLAPEVRWGQPETEDDFFHLILSGQRGEEEVTVALRALREAGPDEYQELLDLAGQVADGAAEDPSRGMMSFLLLSAELRDPLEVRARVSAFNATRWTGAPRAQVRAFVAMAPATDSHPEAPGAYQPWPDLPRLELAPIVLGEGPPTAATSRPTPPVPAPEAAAPETEPAPEASRGAAGGPGEDVEVLVVDDDPLVRAMATDLLRGAGLRCAAAESWEEVRRVAFGGGVRVLLLDVMMPGVGGDRVAQLIRLSRPPHPRIVLYSGMDAEQLGPLARRVGAMGWLRKGCPDEEILAAVRAGIEAHRAASR